MEEVLWEAADSGYVKRYKCPYCEKRLDRYKLIRHVETVHSSEIPEGFTPTRVVFNTINKKDHGNCVICGRETSWDENKARYNRICDRPECMNEYKNRTKENMIKIYGTDNLLKDPQQQQRMLANRKISGQYKWSDSTLKGYTGTYEKRTLEFLDKVMNYKSEDVLTPGPVIEYEWNGKKHFWITDIYIPSYNLCIDVKDGGKNPNRRTMREYREKQIAKEKAIINQKQYNYLRLTDNNFNQLMSMLAELKMQLIDNSEGAKISRIHENMFAGISAMMPPDWNNEEGDTYIVNYMMNNVFAGIGVSNNPMMKKMVLQDSTGVLHVTGPEFLVNANYSIYRYDGSHLDIYKKLLSEENEEKPDNYILTQLFGDSPLTGDEWLCRDDIVEIEDIYNYMNTCRTIAGASLAPSSDLEVPVLSESFNPNTVVRMMRDVSGRYFLENSLTGMRTAPKREEIFSDIEKQLVRGGLF